MEIKNKEKDGSFALLVFSSLGENTFTLSKKSGLKMYNYKNKYKAIVLKTIVRQSFPSDEWIIGFFY